MSSKNYAIFWGGGGGVTKRSHWITGGRGGGQDGPKKDRIIFERSLILPKSYPTKNCLFQKGDIRKEVMYTVE